MGIRGRLILAMGFVVATTVLSVTVPQWITLSERTRVELENRNLVRAESIAQRFGPRTLGARDPALAQTLVEGYAAQVGGRVLVVDAQGLLIADSDGVTAGTPYATAGRPEIVGALAGEPTSVVRYSADLGQEIMATAVPIILPGTPADPTTAVIGAVRITQGLGEVRANQRSTLLGLVAVGGGALAAGLLLAFALASSLARPMRQVTSASERFGGGELEVRSGEVGGSREIRRLAAAFDAMADRIARLVRSQREFVGNASHQLRTPLTGMKLQLEGAIASTDDPEMREQLVAADREVDRLAEIVARLLATARGEETKDARVDVGAAAARAVARWRDRAAAAAADLSLVTPDGRPVLARGEAVDVEQVLDVLIDNALAYGAPPIAVRVETDGGTAITSVTDAGPGIAAEDLDSVTDRFYRGSGAAPGGSGLGLAIAREIAERHGGSLEVASGPAGTRVAIRLPLAD